MMFEVYKSSKPANPSVDEWSWRLVKISSNKEIASSSETFSTREECEASIHIVMLTDYSTPVIKTTDNHRYTNIEQILKAVSKAKPQVSS